MLPCGTTALEFLEANKENYPLSQFEEKSRVVLPPQKVSEKDSEEIDVVSVSDSVSSVLLTPCMSQSSHASTMSPASPMGTMNSADEDTESDDGDGAHTSRKEKSLGLLCQRFLVAMNEETRNSATNEVHLESVARKMNVEKRRIYDIVNVMEALDAMNKTNKSFYRWHGLQDLPRLMNDLQKEATLENLPERVLRVEQAMCSFTELPGKRENNDREGRAFVETSSAIRTRVESRDRQGRNSLAQLCRRFLMVLLSNPKSNRRVSLDVASTVLIKDPETEGYEPPSRSRCRRLYDIANVLVALGLIKKIHYQFGTKKIPLFVYCGPEPDESAKYDANACLERMLTSSSSAPQTPLMKATTAAMVHSLSLGKRSQSDANIARSSQDALKMPRMRSDNLAQATSSSLMMFAELAAERLRLESQEAIMKPQPQHFPLAASAFHVSPLSLSGIVLPPRPMWTTVAAPPAILSSPLTTRPSLLPKQMPTSSSEYKPLAPKHSVSNILGDRTNNLDHKQSSPFQVVKKTPFAALHNLGNSRL